VTLDERSMLLHKVLDELSVAVSYLELAATDLRLVDADDAQGSLRLIILADRAIDLAQAVRRLVADAKKT
jgi:hypothetical protein